MADINQSGGIFVPGQDIPVRNYGGTDIPANTGVLWDTANAGGSQLAPGVVVPSSNGGSVARTAGITHTVIPAGGSGLLRVGGTEWATASSAGAITIGDPLYISSLTGSFGQLTNVGTAIVQVGWARTSCAAGDPVKCAVQICKNS